MSADTDPGSSASGSPEPLPLGTMRERRLRVRGVELAVCEWGAAAAPAVVCCHGWLDQGAAWDRVAVALVSRGYRVVAPDHRGHGGSAWTPPGTTYHFMEYVADLDVLMASLGLEAALLVGHSMGGTIASLYAGLRPARVRGLVLLDGLGPPAVTVADAADQATTFLDHSAVQSGPSPRVHRPLPSLDSAVERLRGPNPSLPLAHAQALARRATVDGPGGLVWRWDPLHRTRAAVAYDEARHLEILGRVDAPVVVAIGADGWYGHLPGLPGRIERLGAVRAVEHVACGHDLHHAVPERIAAWVDLVAGPQEDPTTVG